MNSVCRSNNKCDSIANGIKLILRNPLSREKVIFVIEGKDDKKFYERFTDNRIVEYVDTCGCRDMKGVLENVGRKYAGRVAGVKDADFAHLCGIQPGVSNQFFTDFHDHEMFVVNEERVKKTAKDLGMDDETAINSVCSEVVGLLDTLSCIKWYNYQAVPSCRVSFKQISVHSVQTMSLEECIEFINSKQKNPERKLRREVVGKFIEDNAYPRPHHLLLHNGHDYIDALLIVIKNSIGRNLKLDTVKETLLSQYGLDDFRSTALYLSLANHFSGRNIFRS